MEASLQASTLAPLQRNALPPLRLFPETVRISRLLGTPPEPELGDDEALMLAGAGDKRRRDYAAGRLCARQALAQLGQRTATIPVQPDGAPQWPRGITGSISHCDGYIAAAVARKGRLLSIGLDIERIEGLDGSLTSEICTPNESIWLRNLPEARRMRALALLFSAKEALYKCQHPLTGRWIEFGEVALRPHGERIVVENSPPELSEWSWHGRYQFSGGYVLTGFCARKPAKP